MATPNTSPLNYGDRCAVELPHGTTIYGVFRGWVFGDPNAAAEGFVQATEYIWADGTVKPGSGGMGKFWDVRPLTDEERAAEAAKLEADRIRYDF